MSSLIYSRSFNFRPPPRRAPPRLYRRKVMASQATTSRGCLLLGALISAAGAAYADPVCGIQEHSALGDDGPGTPLSWGMSFHTATAEECCSACVAHAAERANTSESKCVGPRCRKRRRQLPCNSFNFCPEPMCWANDVNSRSCASKLAEVTRRRTAVGWLLGQHLVIERPPRIDVPPILNRFETHAIPIPSRFGIIPRASAGSSISARRCTRPSTTSAASTLPSRAGGTVRCHPRCSGSRASWAACAHQEATAGERHVSRSMRQHYIPFEASCAQELSHHKAACLEVFLEVTLV